MIFDILHFQKFGGRLRDERKRLGYSQKDFAKLGGVSRNSQILYEQSAHVPSMAYVSRIIEQGTDFRYLVLGEKSPAHGGRICVEPDVLDRAMTLSDQLCRDEKGRPLESHIRHTLLKAILIMVAEKTEDDVDWESIKTDINEGGFGETAG